MFNTFQIFFVIVAYLGVLFLVAHYAERREREKRSIVSNPYVYALSIAVYCTSWTFYGSVGKAANSGLDFLTIYLGPTLMASLWWIILKKAIRIAKNYRITTISDFIGVRYGNSLLVSAVVTGIAVVGIMPYLGLQITSIINTVSVCTGNPVGSNVMGWLITVVLGGFAIMFGARRLDASERHGGLVFAVAFESVIKLFAFVLVGLFVTYGLFDGFGDIFGQIHESEEFRHLLSISDNPAVRFEEWLALTFLSMMAIMFLPRQFHVSVVENSSEDHIRKAMWLFPLYLLAINIFVLPVAFGGLLRGMSPSLADLFMLILPLSEGNFSITLATFLGGFSAATAMIIVESLALSTMVMNSFVVPGLYRLSESRRFSFVLLNVKRLVILGCVVGGFSFAAFFGKYYSLVDMGLKSFEAVSLFAPPFLIGMYWKGGNRKGAIAGLIAGFSVWLYTLLLPAMMKTGIIGEVGFLHALVTSNFLNPHALFGLAGLDKWTHSLFWSLLLNCFLYVGVSVFTRQDEEEAAQALAFVEMFSLERPSVGRFQSIDDIEDMLCQYMGYEEGKEALAKLLEENGVDRQNADEEDVAVLRHDAEKVLAGGIGASVAKLVLKDTVIFTDRDKEELSRSVKDMADSLRLSRQELTRANRELSYLKDFSERIIESIPLGIAKIDEGGLVDYWNRHMEGLTGIPKDVAKGKNIQKLIGGMHSCFLNFPMEPGEYVCDDEGRKHGLEDSVVKVSISRFAGAEKGFVLVVEDITERRRLERELSLASKHASLGRLTAGVSHEIGNPLASISSLVQELMSLTMDNTDDVQFSTKSLKAINGHLERIARIVRRLGDFARTSSSERIRSSIAEILERTLMLVRYDKRARNIRIIEDMAELPPLNVNPDQLQQVFLNLMLNALDAMPDGGTLTVKAERRNSVAEITVSDTGSGMEKMVLDRIFDPFFTTKPLGRGTGLGLSICYGIINDHNGSITVKSKRNEGSAFIIRLPVESTVEFSSSVAGGESA